MFLSKNKQQLKFCIPYILLILAGIFFTWLFCFRYGVFGAKVDWISQHSVFPEYFREQFYQTGKLIPEFAPNIGGGENIFYFAYYGLLSPIFLPSYLLPFVKMSDYVMGVTFLCLLVSVLLLYRWLRRQPFSVPIAFGTALLFLLSGPMIAQSYSQIMFVDYMPFLILGLIKMEQYITSRTPLTLIQLALSVFLMIMTSFYYSIGGLIVLGLYGLYVAFQPGKFPSLSFILPMIYGILLSAVLLVPTAFALASRSSESAEKSVSYTLKELLLPHLQFQGLFYSPYGIGLTTFALTVLFAALFSKLLKDRLLGLAVLLLLFIPLAAYCMNGALYIRDKVLIPVLPLVCFLIARYLSSFKEAPDTPFFKRILPYFMTVFCLFFYWTANTKKMAHELCLLLLVDASVMILTLCILTALKKTRQLSLILLLPCLIFLCFFDQYYASEKSLMMSKNFYRQIHLTQYERILSDVTGSDDSLYRTEQWGTARINAANINRIWNMKQYSSSLYSSSYNSDYMNFRRKTFQLDETFRNYLMQGASANPIFQRLMGEKYIVSNRTVKGYRLYKNYGQTKVYKNEAVAPVIYGTNRLLNLSDYQKLPYPYNQIAFLSAAVIDGSSDKTDNTIHTAGNGNSIASTSNVTGTSSTAANTPTTVNTTDTEIAVTNTTESDNLTDRDIVSATPLTPLSVPDDFTVQTTKTETLTIPYEAKSADSSAQGTRVLFLRFRIQNNLPTHDITVYLDGVRNKLTSVSHDYYNENTTFTYAVALEDTQTQSVLTFEKGNYTIQNMEAYIGYLPDETASKALYQSVFTPDFCDTTSTVPQSTAPSANGDVASLSPDSSASKATSSSAKEYTSSANNTLSGTIDMNTDGYLVTSIPYDKGFQILVDGKNVTCQKVNTAFLGCQLSAGTHRITILYHAPGLNPGKIVSIVGLLLILLHCGFLLLFHRQKPQFPRIPEPHKHTSSSL